MAKPYLRPLSRKLQLSFDRTDVYLVLALLGLCGASFVLGFWVATFLLGEVR